MKPQPWTSEEDRILFIQRSRGLFFGDIAKMLPGRSEKSAQCRYQRLFDGAPVVNLSASGPAIAVCDASERLDAIQGSQRLLEAYARYYQRHVAGRAAA